MNGEDLIIYALIFGFVGLFLWKEYIKVKKQKLELEQAEKAKK